MRAGALSLLVLFFVPITEGSLSVVESYQKHLNDLHQPAPPPRRGPMRVKRYKCVEEYVDLEPSSTEESNEIFSQPGAAPAPPASSPPKTFTAPPSTPIGFSNDDIEQDSFAFITGAPPAAPPQAPAPPPKDEEVVVEERTKEEERVRDSPSLVPLPPTNSLASSRAVPVAERYSYANQAAGTSGLRRGDRISPFPRPSGRARSISRPIVIVPLPPSHHQPSHIATAPFPPVPEFGTVPEASDENDTENISVNSFRHPQTRAKDVPAFVPYSAKAFRAYAKDNNWSDKLVDNDALRMWTFSEWKTKD